MSLRTAILKSAKKVIPRRVKLRLFQWYALTRLLEACFYDFRRYSRWSALARMRMSRSNMRAVMAMNAHRLEKGLSLPEPRPGFGKATVRALLDNMQSYKTEYGTDNAVDIACNTLKAYADFNRRHSHHDPELDRLIAAVLDDLAPSTEHTEGGAYSVTGAAILQQGARDLRAFFASRHSVRNFSPEPVSDELIRQAVEKARYTPSVCNRQSWRVHVLEQDEDKKLALECQNGNRGFGHQASRVLVITSDLESFVSVGERYQGWIDGGMFSMTLLWALHALGLGACPLNWSVDHRTDLALRKRIPIPANETVIMMIAVGHLPEKLFIARSARLPVETIMRTYPNGSGHRPVA